MAIDKSQFIEQFKSESKEHIQNLTEGLLELEKSPDDKDIFEKLMREAHTIKGSASMMGYSEIADIAHKMEDAFESAPVSNPDLIIKSIDYLLECLDTMDSILETQIIGQADSDIIEKATQICKKIDEIMTESSMGDKKESDESESCKNDSSPEQKKEYIESMEVSSTNEASDIVEPEKEKKLQNTIFDSEQVNNNHENQHEKKSEEEAASKSHSESLRVNIDKLNNLMNLSGEMLTSRIRLNALIKTLNAKTKVYNSDNSLKKLIEQLKLADEKISFVTSNLQNEIMKMRMVPISNLFSVFPRAMRDLAQKHQKKVEFSIKGEETQLDKSIIDQIKEPLMHLLRNAVDHGLEIPEERFRNNKREAGQISLNAYHSGSQVIIEISDDGRGIEVDKVKEKAISRNIVSLEKVSQMTDEQIYQFLFVPGFSTASTITETSGRGVGLDVVKENVVKLKGVIGIKSKPGNGTIFTIKLPLTLMITECLLVDCSNEIYGIPIDNIVETARINLSEIETIGNKEVITIRDNVIPLARLNNMFCLPGKGIIEKKYIPVIIVQSMNNKLAILVDQIVGHHEIMVKPLGYPLRKTKNISGAAILGDGNVVLVLDILSIINSSDGNFQCQCFVSEKNHIVKDKVKSILLAEDTLSTAMLEKNILEAAGFSVIIARDGKEALERAAQEKFDLVISDVLMPKVNGYELTSTLKKDKYYKNIPVIIVTTRESDSDKKKGLDSGADAYLLKKDFTSEILLETIDQLITVRN